MKNCNSYLAAYRKYAMQIADQLLVIAGIPDLKQVVVKEKIMAFMVLELSVSRVTAWEIACAIELSIPLVIAAL